MTFFNITQDQVESLASYATNHKGTWYTAANNTKDTALRIKSHIIEEGFRESGIDLFTLVEPFKEGVTTAKIDLEDAKPIVTISDKPEVAFAFAAVLDLLSNKEITNQFNKTVVVASVGGGGFSISPNQSFQHRDDGIVDRGGAKLKYVYNHG